MQARRDQRETVKRSNMVALFVSPAVNALGYDLLYDRYLQVPNISVKDQFRKVIGIKIR